MSAAMVEQIRTRLEAALAPQELDVVDEGHLHAGHANAGKGHYRVRIVSRTFDGVMPLKRHRMIYLALHGLMDNGIHALAIEARSSGE